MDILGDLAIGGVSVVPLVIGLVTLAKNLGMPPRYAPYLNGALSVAGFFAASAVASHPALLEVAEPVATAIVIFLMSSGVYQLSKSRPK